ncbi:MAG: hypothetical protein M1827_005277 [Pycnora praestabilis]|nr:MAG: hypothetical protein M1827_005277 [Pycnora praestabilis]
MPPRLSTLTHVRVSNLPFRQPSQVLPSCAFIPYASPSSHFPSIAPINNASTLAQKRKFRDPYALVQARQRKAANLARQEVLKKEREASLGDPVRGITTPFLESFDTAIPQPITPTDTTSSRVSTSSSPDEPPPTRANATEETYLNHLLTTNELVNSLQHSHLLTQPLPSTDRSTADPTYEEEQAQLHKEGHDNAEAAISRIVSLANGNSKDRTRANIQRCIDTFGRHNTDTYVAPRAPSNVPRAARLPPPPEKTPRAGPDTGSSEVQVAILTAKIRVLANHMEGDGRMDKVNKRNLRLLVHRRQKLLAYLRRKERGGERWQNLIQTLGLTDGTWKGEISL